MLNNSYIHSCAKLSHIFVHSPTIKCCQGLNHGNVRSVVKKPPVELAKTAHYFKQTLRFVALIDCGWLTVSVD